MGYSTVPRVGYGVKLSPAKAMDIFLDIIGHWYDDLDEGEELVLEDFMDDIKDAVNSDERIKERLNIQLVGNEVAGTVEMVLFLNNDNDKEALQPLFDEYDLGEIKYFSTIYFY